MFPAEIDVAPVAFVERLGRVFARFGAETQDSGNAAYGVETPGGRLFVKTAGDPADTAPYLDFEGRVALLRNGARLARQVSHPALATLRAAIESPGGPLLVYDWREGEHLGTTRESRDDPATAFQRFRALPAAEIVAALDTLYDLHARLDAAGWVEGDFYDGALLYDFGRRRLTVVDLDSYRHGPHVNDMGRMFGASRFMAPEQLTSGAPIDSRTTAYVMARAALVLLSDATLARPAFRGTDEQYAVLLEATTIRFADYPSFYASWRSAGVPRPRLA